MINWIKKLIAKKIGIIFTYLMDKYHEENVKNITFQLQKNALIDTTEFVEKNMLNTKSFPDKFSLIKYSLNLTIKNGLFLEFGVYKGETINFIAKNTDQIVYGFDSFEGLPEFWRDGYEKGTFKLTELPEFRENVKIVKGWFQDTLPQFTKKKSGKCSFIHIDCDLYSSTKIIFEFLGNQIEPNTIIVFDEFFNYPGWKKGEYKAFNEFINSKNLNFEYLGYCQNHEQVAVKILSGEK